MRRYALIGRRLEHSWSQRWFEEHFERLGLHNYAYELKEMDQLDGLRQWVEKEGIEGFNVTVPYKQSIVQHLDTLDTTAKAIGAVNCVHIEHGQLIGYNTDTPAFLDTILNSKFEIRHCIVLGTGGAAHAVAYALRQIGVDPLFVSRQPQGENQVGYDALCSHHCPPQTLIVNATPVGMYPHGEDVPLDLRRVMGCSKIDERWMVYDLIYNPSPTRLLHDAALLGARTMDGLAMLERQAELSWNLWNKMEPSRPAKRATQ